MTNEYENREFRGLFLGEGYCSIVRYKRKESWKTKNGITEKEYYLYRPQLTLTQRADNKELVNWIKEKYGGNVWIARQVSGKHNPAFNWVITNVKDILKITQILLNGSMPSKKLKSIQIVNEYCKWKLNRGLQTKMSLEDYQLVNSWYNECQENHSYK